MMRSPIIAGVLLYALAPSAHAACGTRGGPGYRAHTHADE
jgi:hypothetical protein